MISNIPNMPRACGVYYRTRIPIILCSLFFPLPFAITSILLFPLAFSLYPPSSPLENIRHIPFLTQPTLSVCVRERDRGVRCLFLTINFANCRLYKLTDYCHFNTKNFTVMGSYGISFQFSPPPSANCNIH